MGAKLKIFYKFAGYNSKILISLIKFHFSELKGILNEKHKILITSHSNPDGDALGSTLALYFFLKNLGQHSQIIVPDGIPDFLSWMPGKDNIVIFNNDKDRAKKIFKEATLIYSLDYNAPTRIGEASKFLETSTAYKILIDHHIDPDTEFFDLAYSTVDISSTSELVYSLMTAIDDDAIDQNVVECIFTGIVTDTGSFSYNCNYPQTFEIVSQMIKKGLDINKINRLIYATNRESRLRLLGHSLSKKLIVNKEFNTAYIFLSKKELEHYQYQVGDTEGLVNYALSIENIKLAALFTKRDDKIRISFRSVGDFSVNNFARIHFEGGGHRNAAGGDSFVNMKQTIQKFERLLSLYPELKK